MTRTFCDICDQQITDELRTNQDIPLAFPPHTKVTVMLRRDNSSYNQQDVCLRCIVGKLQEHLEHVNPPTHKLDVHDDEET